MAEVINQQSVGVDFSGLQAAQPNPTVGSEGRTAVPGVDFSGLATILKGAAEGISGIKIRQDQEKKAEILGSFAEEYGDLTVDASTLSSKDLAARAFGLNPDDVTPEEAEALNGFGEFQKRLEQARKSGKPDLAIELAKSTYRQRMMRNFPQLSEEIIAKAASVNTLTSAATQLQTMRATVERQQDIRRQVAIQDKINNLLTPGELASLPEDERVAIANNRAQVQMAAIQAAGQLELQVKQAQLSKLEHEKTLKKWVQSGGANKVMAGISTQALEIVNEFKGDPAKTQFAMNGMLRQRMQQIMTSGNLTGAEFERIYGDSFSQIRDTVNNLASGELEADAVSNKLVFLQKSTMLGAPGLVKVTAKLDLVPPELIELLNHNDTFINTVLDLVEPYFNKDKPGAGGEGGDITGAAGERPEQGGDKRSGVNTTTPPVPEDAFEVFSLFGGRVSVTTEDLVDTGKFLSELITYWRMPIRNDSDSYGTYDNASARTIVSVFSDESAKGSLAAVREISVLASDPRFAKEVVGMNVPDAAFNTAKRYALASLNSAASVLQQEQGNVQASITDDGLLDFKLTNNTGNAKALARVESEFNKAVKIYAHLNGKSSAEAYSSVAKILFQSYIGEAENG